MPPPREGRIVKPPSLIESHDLNDRVARYIAACNMRTTKPAVYTYFTSGLLHIFWAMTNRVPVHIDHRLIVSDMTPEELSWLDRAIDKPLLSLTSHVSDLFVWEQLGYSAGRTFVWLDVDMLIGNRSVLDEVADAANLPGVAVSGCFRHKPIPWLATPICAVNWSSLQKARDQHGAIGLGAYGWSCDSSFAISDVALPRDLWADIQPLVRSGPDGYPDGSQTGCFAVYPGRRYGDVPHNLGLGHESEALCVCLDTLMTYQLAAYSSERRLVAVRNLSMDQQSGRELYHIGGISYLRRELNLPAYGKDDAFPLRRDSIKSDANYTHTIASGQKRAVGIDLLLLEEFCKRWPLPGYRSLLERTLSRLQELGENPISLIEGARHLMSSYI